VATNLVVSEERRTGRFRAAASWLGVNGHAQAPSQEATLIVDEERRRVADAVAGLPLAFRVAVVLHDVDGLSYEEIAVIEGCPIGTVRSRISRGRALLKERLGPWLQGASR